MRAFRRLEVEEVEEQEPAVDGRGFTRAQWAALDASLLFVVVAVAVTAVVIGAVAWAKGGPWY